MQYISPQNLECVALSDQKLWRVPNFKFRSRDPDHAHYGSVCCALAGTCHIQSMHQM